MTQKDEQRKETVKRIEQFAKEQMEALGVSCDSCAYESNSGRCYDCSQLTFDMFFDEENNNQ